MTRTTATAAADTCPLPPAAADAALRTVVEAGALARVRPVHRPTVGAVHVTLTGRDAKGLHGHVSLLDDADRELLESPRLSVEVSADGTSYEFTTRCLSILEAGEEAKLLFEHAPSVHVLQRRRARRYQFQRPSRVSLWLTGDEEAGPFEGAVLNLSSGGLACRSSAYVGSLLHSGNMVRVELVLGDPEHVYSLPARVVGIVPASSENCSLLNLEFAAGDESQAAAVRSVLSELANA